MSRKGGTVPFSIILQTTRTFAFGHDLVLSWCIPILLSSLCQKVGSTLTDLNFASFAVRFHSRCRVDWKQTKPRVSYWFAKRSGWKTESSRSLSPNQNGRTSITKQLKASILPTNHTRCREKTEKNMGWDEHNNTRHNIAPSLPIQYVPVTGPECMPMRRSSVLVSLSVVSKSWHTLRNLDRTSRLNLAMARAWSLRASGRPVVF